MSMATNSLARPETLRGRFLKGARTLSSQRGLHLKVIPGIIWLIIFCYVPMYGIVIAFKDYKPGSGFLDGAWVGLKHFRAFFADRFALESIKNTLIISLYKLLVCFPAPILFALLLNEIRAFRYKKFVQSVSYLPFFLSWVVMVGIMKTLLGMDGPINDLFLALGITDQRVSFLTEADYFRFIAVVSDLWKGVGWGSILYIAAISGISQDMYESAYLEGASRLQRALRITLPSIMPTVTIMLMLNVSGILGSNFDQHLLMLNAQVSSVATTIDTYVYSVGLQTGRYSFATAISLSRSIIAFVLLFISNAVARKLSDGEQGIF